MSLSPRILKGPEPGATRYMRRCHAPLMIITPIGVSDGARRILSNLQFSLYPHLNTYSSATHLLFLFSHFEMRATLM